MKPRKELFKNYNHKSILSSSESKMSSSKSIPSKDQDICDSCGEIRKLHVVNVDKDYKENWCEDCIKEEESLFKNGK